MKMMRFAVFAVFAVLVLATGAILLKADRCADWQDRYKQVLYSEIVKNSPVIMRYAKIEAIIGKRPTGCDGPPYEITIEDGERYRSQGIGPTTFNGESRALYLRLRD